MNRQLIQTAEQLLMQLIAIPGGSGREDRVMDYLVGQLRRAGAPPGTIHFDQAHRRSIHGGKVGNLVCKLSGTRRGARRLLVAHTDTVPLCAGARPLRRGRWIVPAEKHTALGADDRAGTAVVLATAMEILRRKLPHPPLTLLFTVQEEVGLHGARHVKLALLGRPRLAFNFDGGAPEKLIVGATGGYRMTIRVTGIPSHAGSAPEEGVSAIAIAALAIAELHQGGWHGKIQKQRHSGTCNVGMIHGGEATNVVTPQVELRAEARSHDAKFRRRIVAAIQETFTKAARQVRNSAGRGGKVHFEGQLDYESFLLADNEPCVLATEAALCQLGIEPVRVVSNGGLDANWLTARGIPTVTLGCGQRNGHTVSEKLNRKEFELSCQIALQLATGNTAGTTGTADRSRASQTIRPGRVVGKGRSSPLKKSS